MSQDYVYIKIIIVGASGVGKSSLLMRYVDDTYNDTFISTIGVDFRIKTIDIDGVSVKLQIWDTAGHERFRAITTSYYRGVDAAIIAFDPNTRDGLGSVQSTYDDIKKHAEMAHIVLVSTKADQPCPLVPKVAIVAMVEQLNVDYFETSARKGKGIDEMFLAVAKAKLAMLKVSGKPTPIDLLSVNVNKKCCW
jgi:small GTP-binding protein